MIKRDATMLLRPKTGLKDMVIELDPGTPGAPAVPEGYTIPVSQTRPDVNLDEILANLDRDTRDYLRLLVAGGGEALKDNGPALPQRVPPLRAAQPRHREAHEAARASGARNLARLIHNLQLLVTEVGTKDKELAELVVSQNAVFEAFANQDANLRETFRLLPDTLRDDEHRARKVGRARPTLLGPTLRELRPGARALDRRAARDRGLRPRDDPADPATRSGRSRARRSRPSKALRPAARDLAKITPAARDELRRAQQALQRARLQPARHRGGLPVLGAVAEPHRRIRLLDAGRARPRSGAASSSPTASRSARSRRRARSTTSSAR